MLTAHLLARLIVRDGFAVSYTARLQPVVAVAINLALRQPKRACPNRVIRPGKHSLVCPELVRFL
ncbi:hypothetical protein BDA96_03G428800 [Sorghum bicolor]|uniref:Uncharacterized protein n=1 Tax=Sorghum bicolor TaxID=4558 RepID=A0A921RI17_SORBI|nr:hypothetical protein BDA96_03G428800 [Sorghum bicolor]